MNSPRQPATFLLPHTQPTMALPKGDPRNARLLLAAQYALDYDELAELVLGVLDLTCDLGALGDQAG